MTYQTQNLQSQVSNLETTIAIILFALCVAGVVAIIAIVLIAFRKTDKEAGINVDDYFVDVTVYNEEIYR